MKILTSRKNSVVVGLALTASMACTGSIGSDSGTPRRTTGGHDPDPGATGAGTGPGAGTGAGGAGTGTGAGTSTGASTGAGGSSGSGSGTGGGAGSGGGTVVCSAGQATTQTRSGALPMRRLTRTEYSNTIRDLLGDTSNPAAQFSLDDAVGPLLNNVASSVNALMAEQYRDAAETLATRAVANLSLLVPCNPATAGEDACALQFIQTFARRAFRRPVDPAELAALQKLSANVYSDIGTKADFATRIRVVLSAILQAPSFLYRPQMGMPLLDGSGVVQLDDYEVATRLSYFLWASTPDDALLAAADAKKLSTAPGVEAEVNRLIGDAKFARTVESFHTQWLGLDELGTLTKDSSVYPAFGDALREAMWTDVTMFVDDVVVKGDALLATLLSAPVAFVTPASAPLYGVAYPGKGNEAVRVQLPAGQRAGLITQPSFLAVHANPNQGSPIKRGIAVRERLLCQGLPAPPADVPAPPAPRPGATTRERFAAHTSVPACAGCHTLMDPIGFGLENYDGLGRFRTMEEGLPVDSSGELTGAGSASGKFNGAVELAGRLAQSDEVRACVTSVWLRYALGRAADDCTLDSVKGEFASTNYDVRKLLMSVAKADAFRYGRVN
ncbi:MAG TPA: DUF1592 domain-containing protein [Polyangiaceae bacterium]|nr:DUF1592 domain-containing protein [Polyangiaceae bacterium]